MKSGVRPSKEDTPQTSTEDKSDEDKKPGSVSLRGQSVKKTQNKSKTGMKRSFLRRSKVNEDAAVTDADALEIDANALEIDADVYVIDTDVPEIDAYDPIPEDEICPCEKVEEDENAYPQNISEYQETELVECKCKTNESVYSPRPDPEYQPFEAVEHTGGRPTDIYADRQSYSDEAHFIPSASSTGIEEEPKIRRRAFRDTAGSTGSIHLGQRRRSTLDSTAGNATGALVNQPYAMDTNENVPLARRTVLRRRSAEAQCPCPDCKTYERMTTRTTNLDETEYRAFLPATAPPPARSSSITSQPYNYDVTQYRNLDSQVGRKIIRESQESTSGSNGLDYDENVANIQQQYTSVMAPTDRSGTQQESKISIRGVCNCTECVHKQRKLQRTQYLQNELRQEQMNSLLNPATSTPKSPAATPIMSPPETWLSNQDALMQELIEDVYKLHQKNKEDSKDRKKRFSASEDKKSVSSPDTKREEDEKLEMLYKLSRERFGKQIFASNSVSAKTLRESPRKSKESFPPTRRRSLSQPERTSQVRKRDFPPLYPPTSFNASQSKLTYSKRPAQGINDAPKVIGKEFVNVARPKLLAQGSREMIGRGTRAAISRRNESKLSMEENEEFSQDVKPEKVNVSRKRKPDLKNREVPKKTSKEVIDCKDWWKDPKYQLFADRSDSNELLNAYIEAFGIKEKKQEPCNKNTCPKKISNETFYTNNLNPTCIKDYPSYISTPKNKITADNECEEILLGNETSADCVAGIPLMDSSNKDVARRTQVCTDKQIQQGTSSTSKTKIPCPAKMNNEKGGNDGGAGFPRPGETSRSYWKRRCSGYLRSWIVASSQLFVLNVLLFVVLQQNWDPLLFLISTIFDKFTTTFCFRTSCFGSRLLNTVSFFRNFITVWKDSIIRVILMQSCKIKFIPRLLVFYRNKK